jgi:GNAT superfamily N-acetyltransferase
MQLRQATEADVAALQRVRRSVTENRLSDPGRVSDALVRRMLVERGRGWVAERDGRIVGFAIGDREAARVWALFVEPGHAGAGIGRRLHAAMVDWLFGCGLAEIRLGTEPGTRADAFYQRAGWIRGAVGEDGEVEFRLPRAAWHGED